MRYSKGYRLKIEGGLFPNTDRTELIALDENGEELLSLPLSAFKLNAAAREMPSLIIRSEEFEVVVKERESPKA